MEERYSVVFTGKLQPRTEIPQVIINTSKLFKITEEKSEKLVNSKKERVVKSDLSYVDAIKLKRKLTRAGLGIIIRGYVPEDADPFPSSQNTERKVASQDGATAPSTDNTEDELESIYSPPKSKVQDGKADRMGFAGLFGRFAFYYLLCMIVLSIAWNFIGLKGSSGIAVATIFIAVMLSCTAFAKKNNRYLTKKERVKATIGFSLINLFIQIGFTALVLIALSQPVSTKLILLVLAVPLIIHTPCIYFSIWSNNKRMMKRGELAA